MKTFGQRRRRPARALDDIIDRHPSASVDGSPVVAGVAMGSGIRWTAPTQLAVQLTQLLSLMVLTRLISPEEFGLVALVTVVVGFFDRVLGDTGTTVALVRHPVLTQRLASSVLFFNIAVGLLTTVFLALAGGVLASLLGDVEGADLLRVLGILALVNSVTHVPNALFRRGLRFKHLASVNLTNAIVTAGASISLAVAGWGPWSLVIGGIIGSLTAACVAWSLSDWRPSWYFSRRSITEISDFSFNLSLQNLFGYASYAGDRAIIGRFIGTEALGYYGLANRLMRYPIQTASQTYREVVFPNLARMQDDHRAMTAAYERSVSGIAFLVFPLCATVAAVAAPLIDVALSDAWAPTSSILGIIAITAAIQAVATTTGSLFNARGRADLALRWQIGSSIVLVAAYSIGARWDMVGVAWGYLIGTVVLTPFAFAIPLRLIDARVWPVLRGAVAAGVVASVCGLTGNGVVRLGDHHDVPAIVQLIGGASVTLGLYAAHALLFTPAPMRQLRRLVRPSTPR